IFGGLVLSVFVMIAGPWAIMNHSVELSPTMGGITDPWITYAGAFLQNVFAWSVIPHTVMRVYSAKDTQTARRSLLWGMLISAIVVAYGGVLTAGVIVLDISYSHPDQALIYLMDAIGPVGLALGSAAILAAIMSSTSGMLLSVSASVSQDLYKNVFKSNASDKSVIKLGRITIAIVGALTVILAFNPPELLVSMYLLVLGFLSAGLFIPLVLGIWWKKANNTGAIWGILVGSISYVILMFVPALPEYSQVIISSILCLIVTVLGGLLGNPPSEKVMQKVEYWHEDELKKEYN